MTEERIYLKNTLDGMSSDDLILYIYAENIKILQMACHYFVTCDVEKRVLAINKSIKVISTLMSILNFQAGEVAFRLKSLYTFSIQQLTRANYDKKPELVETVLKIFRDLHGAWKEKLVKDRPHQAAPSEASHNPQQVSKLEIYG